MQLINLGNLWFSGVGYLFFLVMFTSEGTHKVSALITDYWLEESKIKSNANDYSGRLQIEEGVLDREWTLIENQILNY